MLTIHAPFVLKHPNTETHIHLTLEAEMYAASFRSQNTPVFNKGCVEVFWWHLHLTQRLLC